MHFSVKCPKNWKNTTKLVAYFHFLIESDLIEVREMMEHLDKTVNTLLTVIEEMKPAYQHALRILRLDLGAP